MSGSLPGITGSSSVVAHQVPTGSVSTVMEIDPRTVLSNNLALQIEERMSTLSRLQEQVKAETRQLEHVRQLNNSERQAILSRATAEANERCWAAYQGEFRLKDQQIQSLEKEKTELLSQVQTLKAQQQVGIDRQSQLDLQEKLLKDLIQSLDERRSVLETFCLKLNGEVSTFQDQERRLEEQNQIYASLIEEHFVRKDAAPGSGVDENKEKEADLRNREETITRKEASMSEREEMLKQRECMCASRELVLKKTEESLRQKDAQLKQAEQTPAPPQLLKQLVDSMQLQVGRLSQHNSFLEELSRTKELKVQLGTARQQITTFEIEKAKLEDEVRQKNKAHWDLEQKVSELEKRLRETTVPLVPGAAASITNGFPLLHEILRAYKEFRDTELANFVWDKLPLYRSYQTPEAQAQFCCQLFHSSEDFVVKEIQNIQRRVAGAFLLTALDSYTQNFLMEYYRRNYKNLFDIPLMVREVGRVLNMQYYGGLKTDYRDVSRIIESALNMMILVHISNTEITHVWSGVGTQFDKTTMEKFYTQEEDLNNPTKVYLASLVVLPAVFTGDHRELKATVLVKPRCRSTNSGPTGENDSKLARKKLSSRDKEKAQEELIRRKGATTTARSGAPQPASPPTCTSSCTTTTTTTTYVTGGGSSATSTSPSRAAPKSVVVVIKRADPVDSEGHSAGDARHASHSRRGSSEEEQQQQHQHQHQQHHGHGGCGTEEGDRERLALAHTAEQLRQKEAQLQLEEAELRKREAELQRSEEEFRKREAQLQRSEDAFRERDTVLQRSEEEFKERDAALQRAEEECRKREDACITREGDCSTKEVELEKTAQDIQNLSEICRQMEEACHNISKRSLTSQNYTASACCNNQNQVESEVTISQLRQEERLKNKQIWELQRKVAELESRPSEATPLCPVIGEAPSLTNGFPLLHEIISRYKEFRDNMFANFVYDKLSLTQCNIPSKQSGFCLQIFKATETLITLQIDGLKKEVFSPLATSETRDELAESFIYEYMRRNHLQLFKIKELSKNHLKGSKFLQICSGHKDVADTLHKLHEEMCYIILLANLSNTPIVHVWDPPKVPFNRATMSTFWQEGPIVAGTCLPAVSVRDQRELKSVVFLSS
ncbi:hypothetical protein Pelo_454 [Pelomyxa schiedti]|nr:hypothetical protein Pelo_454 [Pelomyxa schiedti]